MVDVLITVFCDFCKFPAKKIGAFLKNQCCDPLFGEFRSVLLHHKRHFLAEIFLTHYISSRSR
jgi:hypothetical protein